MHFSADKAFEYVSEILQSRVRHEGTLQPDPSLWKHFLDQEKAFRKLIAGCWAELRSAEDA
jgi:hypothetical protein